MITGMFNALSGLRTSSQKLQNSANNLANVQTSGFKKNSVTIGEVKSGGSQVTSTTRVNIQGSILPTGNPTDLAIDGAGFFQVALPNGSVGFTRAGRFTTNAAGNMATADGNEITPSINIPGNSPGEGGNGTIISGSLEMSNVDIAEEMVGQITFQAAFTANAKVIMTADEVIGTILDIKS